MFKSISNFVKTQKNAFVDGYNNGYTKTIQEVKQQKQDDTNTTGNSNVAEELRKWLFGKDDKPEEQTEYTTKNVVSDIVSDTKEQVTKTVESIPNASRFVGASVSKLKDSIWSMWANLKKDPMKKVYAFFTYTYGVSAKLALYFSGAVTALMLGAPLLLAYIMLGCMVAHIVVDTYKAIKG